MNAVQKGIDDGTQEQRLILFTKNEIDIEGKSTVSLLVEEVSVSVIYCIFLSEIRFYRSFIPSTCFKLRASFCGLWIITIIMPFALLSSPLLVLPVLWLILRR